LDLRCTSLRIILFSRENIADSRDLGTEETSVESLLVQNAQDVVHSFSTDFRCHFVFPLPVVTQLPEAEPLKGLGQDLSYSPLRRLPLRPQGFAVRESHQAVSRG
jgi:hypothetical protein